MENLEYIIEVYNKENINIDEKLFVEILSKYKKWQFLTDEEKIYERKQFNLLNRKFNTSPLELEYESKSIYVLELIICLINNLKFFSNIADYNSLSVSEKILFRLYNIIYCEKEFLLFSSSLRGTKTHIPYNILEKLVKELKLSGFQEEYGLDEFLVEYKIMLEIFDQNPYDKVRQ